MEIVKHKTLGEAKVIDRKNNVITVKFDRSGSEMRLLIPESFESGLYILDGNLKDEIDAAIAAKKEKERIESEARESARAAAKAAATPTGGKKRSAKTTAKPVIKNSIEQSFEVFLIKADYSEYTPSGNKSTVYSYTKAVTSVLDKEGISWSGLVNDISNIIKKYGVGGPEEAFGKKSNSTVINALRCFEDFVKGLTSATTGTAE